MSIEISNLLIPIANLHENPWNPNQQTEAQFEALIESIMHNGFVDTEKVRECDYLPDGHYEIIGGAHRYRSVHEIVKRLAEGQIEIVTEAFYDHEKGWLRPDGLPLEKNQAIPPLRAFIEAPELPLPCLNLGKIADVHAKRLTIIYNETHGKSNTTDLAHLLAEIKDVLGTEQVNIGLPYGDEETAHLLKLVEHDWKASRDTSPPEESEVQENEDEGDTTSEDDVTFNVTMSATAYAIYMEAREKMLTTTEGVFSDEDDRAHGQALQSLSVRFLNS